MRRQKNCRRLKRYLCILRRQWLRHALASCQGLWFGFKQLRLFVLPNYIVYLWNTWKGDTEDTFLSLITWFWLWFWLPSEAVAWRCSIKKVFLEILQNSQENTCGRVCFLIKLQTYTPVKRQKKPRFSEFFRGYRPAALLKKTGTGAFLWILRNF